MKLVLSLLAIVPLLAAQSAKVVALSDADAAKAKAAYDTLQKAQADWDAVQKRIAEEYVSDSREEPDYGTSDTVTLSGLDSSGRLIVWNGHGYDALQPGGANPCYSDEHSDLCTAYRTVQQEKKQKAEREEKERIAKLPKKTVYTLKSGWQNGFDFSEGFKFIVPKEAPRVPAAGCTWGSLTCTSPVAAVND